MQCYVHNTRQTDICSCWQWDWHYWTLPTSINSRILWVCSSVKTVYSMKENYVKMFFMPIGVLDIRNWFDMGKVHGKTSILEIISEAWNINTDRNDNNDSDCEAEPTIQADALKALNIFIHFFLRIPKAQRNILKLFQIYSRFFYVIVLCV